MLHSSPTTPIHLLQNDRASSSTATPSTYLRYSFPLPSKKVVGLLACQRDPLLEHLDAKVLKCVKREPAPAVSAGGRGNGKKGAAAKASDAVTQQDVWEVELDDTVIFPEGGGQSSDRGTLQLLSNDSQRLEGEKVKVLEAFRRNLSAVHVVDAPLEVGATVRVELDTQNRRDLMCQHTGQHLLSGVIDQLYGTELETLSWSLTPAPQPCYIELPRAPTTEEIALIQSMCNDWILRNPSISVEMRLAGQDGHETPTSVPENYKGEEGEQGVIRTVEIAGLNDANPCCGTHYPSLSFLQSLFVLPHTTSVRGTNARLYFLVGPRVLRHLAASHSLVRDTSLDLGCAAADLPERVNALSISARDSTRREKKLREELAGFLAAQLWRDARANPAGEAGALAGVSLREEDSTNSLEYLTQVAFGIKALADAPPSSTSSYLFALAACSSAGTPASTGSLLIIGSADEAVARAGKAAVARFGAKLKGGGKGRWQGKLTGRWETGDQAALDKILLDALV